MKNVMKLSVIALLTAAAVPAMAGKTEPYTQSGTNATKCYKSKQFIGLVLIKSNKV